MLSEDLRTRIAMLNRGVPVGLDSGVTLRRRGLESLAPGEVVEGLSGQFYRIRRPVADFRSRGLDELLGRNPQTLLAHESLHPELDSLVRSFPSRALFLDLETCGFSGSPLFLIGLLRHLDGELVVEQLLARDYAEEPAVLAHLWGLLPNYDVLVTFNGKAFDWPFVLDRTTAHRLRYPTRAAVAAFRSASGSRRPAYTTQTRECVAPHVHCDLLPLARRFWKSQFNLPNCRLQTLEVVLCRRHRSGDIPGYLIPDAYHRFVRSGQAHQLGNILQHNALDLVTLAQLALMMVSRQVDQ
jgi:uncharacterized protein YprB with RNaseH-like and TPR domain